MCSGTLLMALTCEISVKNKTEENNTQTLSERIGPVPDASSLMDPKLVEQSQTAS